MLGVEKKRQSRKAISLDVKIAILDSLAKGHRITNVGKQFGYGESTIRAIKKNEASIRQAALSGKKFDLKLVSYARGPLMEKTENALLIWIEDLTKRRIPLNGLMIKTKARQFYEQLKRLEPTTSSTQSGKEFSASSGWLTRFLRRTAFAKIGEDTIQASDDSEKYFPDQLLQMIEEGGYCSDQVFKVDGTRLFWKKMPARSYLEKEEVKARGSAVDKNSVSFLFCSNASGDRILKPLLINKRIRPRALKGKDLNKLPLHWRANKNALMTPTIFSDWFYNCFVPEVEAYMKEKDLNFKVLLIVDSAPYHPYLEHPNVQLQYMPPSSPNAMYRIDEDLIAIFKKNYIKRTLQFVLDQVAEGVVTASDVWRKFSIVNCINIATSAIMEISPQTLNSFWKLIWPDCITNEDVMLETMSLSTEIISLAHELGGVGFDTFNEQDLKDLLTDKELSDDDILGMLWDVELNSEEEEVESSTFTAEVIQEGLQLCKKLEVHFLINDPNTERSYKFQRDLSHCISAYRELHKNLQKNTENCLSEGLIKVEEPSIEPLIEYEPGPIDEEAMWPQSTLSGYPSDDSELEPAHKKLQIFLKSEDSN